jgi:heterodisulfide reductase subunit B
VRYAYYPGCSVESTSTAYAISVRRVTEALGLELAEIDDWNCCGATEYFTLNRLVALSVVARNLALVNGEVDQLVTVCSACYLNLKKTDTVLREHRDLNEQVNQALQAGGLSYTPGRLRIRHLLDVLHTDVGEAKIR